MTCEGGYTIVRVRGSKKPGLVLSKHIELQTELFIKRVMHETKKSIDRRIINKITYKEVKLRINLNDKITEILRKLNLLIENGQVKRKIATYIFIKNFFEMDGILKSQYRLPGF